MSISARKMVIAKKPFYRRTLEVRGVWRSEDVYGVHYHIPDWTMVAYVKSADKWFVDTRFHNGSREGTILAHAITAYRAIELRHVEYTLIAPLLMLVLLVEGYPEMVRRRLVG